MKENLLKIKEILLDDDIKNIIRHCRVSDYYNLLEINFQYGFTNNFQNYFWSNTYDFFDSLKNDPETRNEFFDDFLARDKHLQWEKACVCYNNNFKNDVYYLFNEKRMLQVQEKILVLRRFLTFRDYDFDFQSLIDVQNKCYDNNDYDLKGYDDYVEKMILELTLKFELKVNDKKQVKRLKI